MSTYTIGRLAKITGLSIDTIRFYEKEGLFESVQRSSGGYRQFTTKELKQALFIKKTKDLGFTLKEIRDLLSLSNEREQCDKVELMVSEKMILINEKISNLKKMKNGLEKLVRSCISNQASNTCPLLDSLGDDNEN